MARIWKNNGLTIALAALFIVSLVGHFLSGWAVENEELARHGQAAIALTDYAHDPQFISTIFENWESEFLQMSAYVVLTAFLFQRGSAESQDPDDRRDEDDLAAEARKPGASAMLRGGRAARWLYAHSLGLALFALFILSFTLHWQFSAMEANAEAALHGDPTKTAWQYLVDPQLWFESFQNWQSEFLSTAVLVVLSIFLRQKGSPESKPLAAPNSQTGSG